MPFTTEQIVAACFHSQSLEGSRYDAYTGKLTSYFTEADRRFFFLSNALPVAEILQSHPPSSVNHTPNPFADLHGGSFTLLSGQARVLADAILHGPIIRRG
mmetsp:Transcript_17785/g.34782  ORF Transcript_17785/g.34782 Transcript_17785/m.34782 type:complete len:101 (+) Transcript_17785:1452-1754(+)